MGIGYLFELKTLVEDFILGQKFDYNSGKVFLNLDELILSADGESNLDKSNVRAYYNEIYRGLESGDMGPLLRYYQFNCTAKMKAVLSEIRGEDSGWKLPNDIWEQFSYEVPSKLVFEVYSESLKRDAEDLPNFPIFTRQVILEKRFRGVGVCAARELKKLENNNRRSGVRNFSNLFSLEKGLDSSSFFG